MKALPILALFVAVVAGSPAFAETCRSAEALERQMLETPVRPFVARLEPAKPEPGWSIRPWGGFQMAATGLGDVTVLRGAGAEVVTACGLQMTWAPEWTAGLVTSARRFKIVVAPQPSAPRSSVKYAATTFAVTPDKASQTAWLTVTEGARTDHYRLDFPATAVSLLPELHSDGLRLEVAGMRADGVLVYAEFGALKRP